MNEWNWWPEFKEPQEDGWYAIIKCWDPSEGAFPDAAQWIDNNWNWKSNATILGWRGPFSDEYTAKEWSYEHDPCI